jgi:hypothetical protein
MLRDEQLDENAHRLRKVLHKLVAGGALQPMDDIWKAWESKWRLNTLASLFVLPSDDRPPIGIMDSFTSGAAWMAMASADDWFPDNSWPYLLAQRAALLSSGKNAQWGQWPQSFGPLGHFSAVHLFRRIHAETARSFAASGMKRLDLKDFQTDYHSWFDGDKLARKFVLHLAKSIQQLNEADTKILGEFFFPQRSDVFINFASRLQQFRDFPVENVLPEALDLMWTDGLKSIIESEFSKIVDFAADTTDRPQDPSEKK